MKSSRPQKVFYVWHATLCTSRVFLVVFTKNHLIIQVCLHFFLFSEVKNLNNKFCTLCWCLQVLGRVVLHTTPSGKTERTTTQDILINMTCLAVGVNYSEEYNWKAGNISFIMNTNVVHCTYTNRSRINRRKSKIITIDSKNALIGMKFDTEIAKI